MDTFTDSPALAKFVVFETVTLSGDAALAGEVSAPLATNAVAVTARNAVFSVLFIISHFILAG
jgi:hypothetical protein